MRALMIALTLVFACALQVAAEPGLTHLKSTHDVKNTAE